MNLMIQIKKTFIILLLFNLLGLNKYSYCITSTEKEDYTTYTNEYMGITFSYTSSLIITKSSYTKSRHERDYFKSDTTIKKNSLFVIEISYDTFNQSNHYELSMDTIIQISPIKPINIKSSSIVHKKNGININKTLKNKGSKNSTKSEIEFYIDPISKKKYGTMKIGSHPPRPFKIEDIGEIYFKEYRYYSYSFITSDEIRCDVFIYPRNGCYYKFTFYNQELNFIKKLMNSVTFTESVYINTFKLHTEITNKDISLERINVPYGWNYSNSADKTLLTYKSNFGSCTIEIMNSDESELFYYIKKRVKEWIDYKKKINDDDEEYFKNNFGCEKLDYGGIISRERKVVTCFIPSQKDDSDEIYSYYRRGELDFFIKSKYTPLTPVGKKILPLYIKEIEKALNIIW